MRPFASFILVAATLLSVSPPASAGTLTGSARATDGIALPRFDLRLIGPGGGERPLVTGLGGAFDAGVVPAGEYRIAPATPGFTTVTPASFQVGAGTDPVRIEVVLGPSGIAERVVVAATRGDAVASTLGVAVTIIDGGDIEARHPQTLLHLLTDAPGVAVAATGPPGRQASAFVRGGESNFTRVMVDGVVVNAPGGAYDFGDLLAMDVSRIEVVRGAGSSLYGSDALAGVVNIVTREPGPRSLFAEGEGGNFGFWQGRGGASGRSGQFDWRGNLAHLETDNEGPNGKFDETAGSGSFAVRATEKTTLRGILRASHSRTGTPGQTLYGRPDLDAFAKRNDFSAGLTFETRREQVIHTLRAGIADTDLLSVNPLDSGPYTPTFGDLRAPFEFVDFVNAAGAQNDTRRATLGYQAEVQAGAAHLLTLGAEAERETGAVGTKGSASVVTPKRSNFGFYAQDRVAIGGRGFVTLGARVERNDSYGTRVVPRGAVAWRLSSGEHATTLHASGGAGINEPNFTQTFGSAFSLPNPDLKPERSRTFDLGVESWLSPRVRLDVTGFHHTYRDQIAFEIVDFVTFDGAYFNLGQTRAQGIETALDVSAAPGLTFRGAYTWLDGEIIDPAQNFDAVYEKGRELLRRPKHQGSFAARYAAGRFDVGANVVVVGERTDSDFSSLGLEQNAGYTRVDARASVLVRGALYAYVVLENAFDREYQEALGYPALGRSIRFGLSLRASGTR